jgi:glutamyl-tRNA synthetase
MTYDEAGIKKHWKPETNELLKTFITRLEALADFSHDVLEAAVHQLAEERQIKTSAIIHPVRLSISGRQVGPGLYELMHLLGKETVLRRLRIAVDTVKPI